MNDQKNLFAAVIVSLAILIGYQYFYEAPRLERERQTREQAAVKQEQVQRPGAPAIPSPDIAIPADPRQARESAVAGGPRVKIATPRLIGSLALTGARFDDVILREYRETVDPKSAPITLLSPPGAPGAYFAEFGWIPAAGQTVAVPDENAIWRADRATLSPEAPVTLVWDNGQGLRFVRKISVDDGTMFTIEDSVENRANAPATLFPYGLISRWETPAVAGFYILHEGPLGVTDGRLHEYSYSTLREDGVQKKQSIEGGWIGITDKYWLVALVPSGQKTLDTRFAYRKDGATDKYQADYLGTEARTVAPGGSIAVKNYMFAGAKQLRRMNAYSKSHDIALFDRAVVFRWLYFLAEPLFYGLLFLRDLIGNFGLAILVITVGIKLVFYPLANKSYRSMSKMKLLQPELQRIKERCKDDKQRLHQEMMELYKREKVNPAAGCLPVILQIPVFFALYEVLYVTIEMRHAPFYGWIKDLSAPDPTTLFNLFGLIPWTPPSMLMIGVWPLLMGITMFLQQRLSPQPPDPIQARIFMVLPLVFTVILAPFPSGLVIYWAWNNLLSITQQWIIMKRLERATKKTS